MKLQHCDVISLKQELQKAKVTADFHRFQNRCKFENLLNKRTIYTVTMFVQMCPKLFIREMDWLDFHRHELKPISETERKEIPREAA